ncbi:organic cation transporter protein-like [Lineus longissimus]|uniref:organic cation transporter protein-like n=1 Tax=Lineus longissimus TaxID=88925 RepID=UPI002B4D1E4E
MHFDDILIQLGELGKYQIILVCLLNYAGILIGMTSLSMVFTLGIEDFRCAVPDVANGTYLVKDEAHAALVNATIPQGSKCTVYDGGVNGTEAKERACSRWVYEENLYRPSAVMEFNLVCDKAIFRTFGSTALIVGMLLGAIVGGKVSDRFGRKITVILSIASQAVAVLVIAFAPDIYTFMVFRCVLGGSNLALYGSSFTLITEMVGPSKRVYAALLAAISFAVGGMLLTPLAFFYRNWRHLTLATVAPSVLLIPYWWLIPESPRWLLSRGRNEEAEKILRQMAKLNRRPLSDVMLKSIQPSEDRVKRESFMKMLKQGKLLARLAIVCLSWASVSAGYYGLHLYSGSMVGDFYVNFTVGVFMDIPATFYTMFTPTKFGRKAPHVLALLVAGLACVASMFVILYGHNSVLSWLPTTLATIGKFGISAAFGSAYLYSAELFPTSVRNLSIGISSMFARLVTIAAPFLADLGSLIPGPFSKVLPLVVFGSILILAGISSLFLPETHGKPLPETIEQALHWGRGRYRRKSSQKLEMTEKLRENGEGHRLESFIEDDEEDSTA